MEYSTATRFQYVGSRAAIKRKADNTDGGQATSRAKKVRLTFLEAVDGPSVGCGGYPAEILERLKKVCESIEARKFVFTLERGPYGREHRIERSNLSDKLDVEDGDFIQQSQRILSTNLDSLGNLEGIPYELIKPVLENCSARQLDKIEALNEAMVGLSESMWKRHVLRNYSVDSLNGFSSWKELHAHRQSSEDDKFATCLQRFKESSSKLANIGRSAQIIEALPLVKATRRAARKNGIQKDGQNRKKASRF